jgi:hypothetical protein
MRLDVSRPTAVRSSASSLRVLPEVRLTSGPEWAGPAWLTDEDSQEPVRFSYPVSATLCKGYGGLAGWLHRRWSGLGAAADGEPGDAAKSGSGAGRSPFPMGAGEGDLLRVLHRLGGLLAGAEPGARGRHRPGRCVRCRPPLRTLVTSRTGSSLGRPDVSVTREPSLGRKAFRRRCSEVPFVYFRRVRRLVCGLVFDDVPSVRASS